MANETLTVFAKSKIHPVVKLGTNRETSEWFKFPVELVSDHARDRDFAYGKIVNVEYHMDEKDRVVSAYSFVEHTDKPESNEGKVSPAEDVIPIVIKSEPIAATITDNPAKVPEGSKQYDTVKDMLEDLPSNAISEVDIARWERNDNKSFTAQVLAGRTDVSPKLILGIYEAFKACK